MDDEKGRDGEGASGAGEGSCIGTTLSSATTLSSTTDSKDGKGSCIGEGRVGAGRGEEDHGGEGCEGGWTWAVSPSVRPREAGASCGDGVCGIRGERGGGERQGKEQEAPAG